MKIALAVHMVLYSFVMNILVILNSINNLNYTWILSVKDQEIVFAKYVIIERNLKFIGSQIPFSMATTDISSYYTSVF